MRALAPAFSIFEMLAVRNAAGVLILLLLALLRPDLRPGLKPRRFPLHLARNVLHFLGTDGWAFGLTLLPLATVFALEFTSPAWVTLLAVLFLGEALTGSRLVAVTDAQGRVVYNWIITPPTRTLAPGAYADYTGYAPVNTPALRWGA